MPIASVRPSSALRSRPLQPSDGNCDVDDDDEKLAAEAIKPVQFDSSADERSTAHSRASLYSYELTFASSWRMQNNKGAKSKVSQLFIIISRWWMPRSTCQVCARDRTVYVRVWLCVAFVYRSVRLGSAPCSTPSCYIRESPFAEATNHGSPIKTVKSSKLAAN